MKALVALLNGQQEPGRSAGFWLAFAVCFVGMSVLPFFLGKFGLLNLNSFLVMVFLAAGLALIWGFGGVLSLGQSAFFGLGGYAYGIIAIDLADRPGQIGLAVLGGLLVPVLVAALLSWLMFYGRLRGVYVAITMLIVTLLLETFLNQTAGPQWTIGTANLGGNNGLGRFSGDVQDLPSLAAAVGDWSVEFDGSSPALFYLMMLLGFAAYLGLRILVNSRFGVVLTAIREDPVRTELLGYDVRLVQAVALCLSAALAALSGILYVSWGNFITPSVFGVTSNVLPVIWVAVAGRKSLAASILGAVVLQWGSQALATQGEYALVVQGGLLVAAVLVLPDGILSLVAAAARRARQWRLQLLASRAA